VVFVKHGRKKRRGRGLFEGYLSLTLCISTDIRSVCHPLSALPTFDPLDSVPYYMTYNEVLLLGLGDGDGRTKKREGAFVEGLLFSYPHALCILYCIERGTLFFCPP
jgi:hypothetical protein